MFELFYSVNSLLAHEINEKYYKGKHFVWVTDCFDKLSNGPSGNPHDIFWRVYNAIRTIDRGCTYWKQNKFGLRKGANEKLKSGEINENQHKIIMKKIKEAQIAEFHPLIYIIDKSIVNSRARKVDFGSTLTSEEYIIEDLTKQEFDYIKLLPR